MVAEKRFQVSYKIMVPEKGSYKIMVPEKRFPVSYKIIVPEKGSQFLQNHGSWKKYLQINGS